MSTLTVLVTDTFGALLPGAQIELRRLQGDKELPIRFTGANEQAVRFGTYRITALVSGYTAATRTVDVNQPTKLITLALALGEIEGPSTRDVRGRLEPFVGTARPIWVKLVGIYSDEIMEAPVNEKGRFLIQGVLPGEYVAIVLESDRVLNIQRFGHKFRDGAELVIRLSR